MQLWIYYILTQNNSTCDMYIRNSVLPVPPTPLLWKALDYLLGSERKFYQNVTF